MYTAWLMVKKPKRTNPQALHVMTTKDTLKRWRAKAKSSGMTLREWVTRTLDAGPILRVNVKPARSTIQGVRDG